MQRLLEMTKPSHAGEKAKRHDQAALAFVPAARAYTSSGARTGPPSRDQGMKRAEAGGSHRATQETVVCPCWTRYFVRALTVLFVLRSLDSLNIFPDLIILELRLEYIS